MKRPHEASTQEDTNYIYSGTLEADWTTEYLNSKRVGGNIKTNSSSFYLPKYWQSWNSLGLPYLTIRSFPKYLLCLSEMFFCQIFRLLTYSHYLRKGSNLPPQETTLIKVNLPDFIFKFSHSDITVWNYFNICVLIYDVSHTRMWAPWDLRFFSFV